MKTFSDSFKVTAIAIAFAGAWSIEQTQLPGEARRKQRINGGRSESDC